MEHDLRTERATPKRRLDARRAGQVARSQDLTTALLLLAVTGAVTWGALPLLERAGWMLDAGLSAAGDGSQRGASALAARLGAGAVAVALPLLLAAWAAAYAAQVVQVGWIFSARPIVPSWSRVDPRRGVARLFAPASLVRTAIDVAKLVVVVAVATLTLRQHADLLAGLPYLGLRPALTEAGAVLLELAVRVALALLLLGLVDLAYQRWKHERDLRMTRDEVREELKQTEGDPLGRMRRRRLREGMTGSAHGGRARLVLTGADVAVAVDYDEAMSAPRVVTKAVQGGARRLIELASRQGVAVVERPALAAALYRSVRPGGEVPSGVYGEMARVIAELEGGDGSH